MINFPYSMFLTRRLLCVVCLVASAMAGTTTPPPAKSQPPNVILITLDTTRADRMGFLGSKRGLTPNLDALARQAVVFTHAYSQVPLTTASHATILTGTYPQFHQVNERRGGEVIGHTLEWLTTHYEGPFFVWVHLYDPHDPYDPPEPYKTKYAAAPYDGEIAYADAAVGKLLSWLRLRGLYDGALIAVMADHGEALGEHGETTHGIFLYDETIRVPLLFKLPRGRSAGKRIESRAGLVDVLPTILEAVGIAIPHDVQGESLLSMLKPTILKPATLKPAPAGQAGTAA